MDGTEAAPRWRGWKVVVLVAVVLSIGLVAATVSCSGVDGGAEQASSAAPLGGPDPADVAALGDPGSSGGGSAGAATTTTAGRSGSTGTGTATTAPAGSAGSGPGDGAGPAGGPVAPARLGAADCAALERVVIPAAAIITEADFVPVEEREPGPDGGWQPAVERVAVIVPADQRPAWVLVAGAPARAQAEHRGLTGRDRADLQDARNASEVWARSACPDAPPSWRCDHFGSIGSGPDVAPTRPEGATPAAVLRRYPDTGRAVELQRTDGVVLFGWVDGSGFVTRTHQVERVGGGWATSRRHVCHGEP